jgi:hypothetical protein
MTRVTEIGTLLKYPVSMRKKNRFYFVMMFARANNTCMNGNITCFLNYWGGQSEEYFEAEGRILWKHKMFIASEKQHLKHEK